MRCSAPILQALILLAGGGLCAQDADTVVTKDDQQRFTIVSQIQDPKEAAAFLSVLRTSQSASRYELANTFLSTYAKSWLLPQALDIAAKSAIDLGKYNESLADGRLSLRLFPENPSLLILLANLEAQQGLSDLALKDANDALEYLDEIERPPGMTQAEWDPLKPHLKASAFFARARAGTSKALATKQPGFAGLLSALDDLNKAAALNSEDAEVFYLRAIVELQLGRKSAAASDLAFVFKSDHPLRANAKNILTILSAQMSGKDSSLDLFLKNLPARFINPEAALGVRQQPGSESLAEGYVGPEACKGCHGNEYAAWRKTGMAKMLQPYRPENVFGDFSRGSQYSENGEKGAQPELIRMGFEQRPYFELRSLGAWQRFYVDFTIGSKWQQGYATKLPEGRLQVLPIEYNLLQKRWINYWKIIDPPGSARASIRNFQEFTPATSYRQNCAICHTSQLKLGAGAASSIENAVYLQPGIDCEMCHGPGARHIKQVVKGVYDHPSPTEPPFDFAKANNRDGVRVCAQCHRQSAVRKIGDTGEMNYSTEGNFVPTNWVRSYDAFSRNAFYKDGRFRETTFIVDAFTRSACYRRGTAQCATCHSPHLGNFEVNKASLKNQNNPNEMCLPCHSQYRNRISQHSHHAANSDASQCVSCHMPRIANALLFKARSHQIEIPSADLTERFGQEESPNVCLTCHSDKEVGWAKEQLAYWRH